MIALDFFARQSQQWGFRVEPIRIIKLSRTIADLTDSNDILPEYIAEALQ
jgi:predicted ATPase with chaperone activity